MSDLIELQRKYVALHKRAKDLTAELKSLGDQIGELEPILAEQMAAIGQSSTKIDGMRLTMRVTPRVGKLKEVPTEDFCKTLEGTPWAWLVKPNVNANTLQATMKEVIEETGDLPPQLAPMLRRWDQVNLVVTAR